MLVFHGTGGPRSLIDQIFDEGLTPAPHTWAHDTTGINAHVFACTTPIGGRGGDPITFAQRRANKDTAWLFVLDVPRELIRGAVPNHELEQYWKVGTFATSALAGGLHENTLAVIAHKRDRRLAARELFDYEVRSTADGLCKGTPDAQTLVQFEGAYHRAHHPAEKVRVASSYGLTLPNGWSSDPHYPWCLACMNQLFEVEIVARDIPARTSLAPDTKLGPAETLRYHRGSWTKLDLTDFGHYVDVLDRWLAAHGDPPFSTLDKLQRTHPPPRDIVPRAMWRDFVTADLDARIREPDTQLLLGAVPPEHIVGAIDIGTRSRLSNLVRPKRGETLLDKLWFLARQLADQRSRSDRPLRAD